LLGSDTFKPSSLNLPAMKNPSLPPWKGYQLDDSIPYLMNRITGMMNRQLELDLRALGVSFQHWRILAVLAQKDGSSITDLSEYAVVPHSSLSRLLVRMETEGYVRREMDLQDARTVRVYATTAGVGLYRKMVPMAVGIREQALTNLSGPQKDKLLELLKHLLVQVQAG
jgi:DNA-binding MarR family transcriptional regulator